VSQIRIWLTRHLTFLYFKLIFICMRKERKYNYIYKTTCNVTGRYYIGMHSTDDLNDGYMGSGKRLWNSFNYHGKDNHSMEILEYLPTRKELKKREAELVNEDTLKDEMCMNLMTGGQGGHGFWHEEHRTNFIKAGAKAFSDKFKNDIDFREKRLKMLANNSKVNVEEGKMVPPDWTGKKHTEETKEKMRKSKNVGKANSQYGTCWITRDGSNKKIKKEDLDEYLEMGWIRGRK